ncbi:DUF3095 domain-containing protein [Pikeienuella piscinae]|uniref:DUF3095 domain-containing protein n=1 Tax=Pikeienuella piscinae TaxID=2748098 RepID=A0A7L5BWH1_9RHOB|nr:DUF3095 domain-containing protein [Pikeienuella piscinae]QIE55493.1 DUF3095 domain-containing protein [Pikeienuella piscinae]
MDPEASAAFFDALPLRERFDDLARPGAYSPMPDDWLVGAADIEGSTALIRSGAYKTVNTIGAAVISAQINAHAGLAFPYVFGGDGAVFAVPPREAETARAALGATRRWALAEFGVTLRAAAATVAEIRAEGREVAVARYRASRGADYAMFSGGGVSWLEAEMKAGRFEAPIAPEGARPDLTGLSCRWTPMEARFGKILSLVVLPSPDADPSEVAATLGELIAIEEELERTGNPIPQTGPSYRWPPEGLELEAKASRGDKPLWKRKAQLWFETLLALFFFRTGMKAGEFDPGHYCRVTAANVDFRKFDDGLKMTIDCDPETRKRIGALLDRAAERGLLRYGLFEQDAAIMTCIVPSITEDDHVHFVDGAAGGYTAAATMIKAGGA